MRKETSILVVFFVTIAVIIASCMTAAKTQPAPQEAGPTPAPTATAIPPTATTANTPTPIPTDTPTGPRDQFGDGLWRVNIDIIPGMYRTEGGEDCYWERIKDFSGGFESIIANGNQSGPIVAEVAATDAGFGSQRCGVWLKVN